MKTLTMTESSDAKLVADSLAGNREAFGGIVARYQTLICSLAYSGTGSLSQSEDLAQETFIAAWRQLAGLREPEKLRSWLCGIARNLIFDALKAQGREPSHHAGQLEEVAATQSPEPLPAERAMSQEEMRILWRSLEQIPEIYREPLVLFYREHQSIEAVAKNLELTEDTVKQRLSRGRKLLHEQVLAFVEGALERTSPGKVFTLSVLAALPALTFSAKAATLGAAAAKGGVTAKAAVATGLLGVLFSPLVAFLGVWLGYRLNQAVAQSDAERAFNRRLYRWLMGCIAAFFLVFGSVMFFAEPLVKKHVWVFVGLIVGISLTYAVVLTVFLIRVNRARKKMLAEVAAAGLGSLRPIWEYRSRLELLGLPFIHVCMNDPLRKPVKAWIACGDCAIGVLFAAGGLAIAPVSFGGCAIGLISMGGFSLGLFSFGGMALGLATVGGFAFGAWAFGGLAIAWQAYGGCAIAVNAALGGLAIARDFAAGGLAHAHEVNNHVAMDFINAQPFFQMGAKVMPYLFWMNLLWVVPLMIQWWFLARKNKNRR